MLRLREQAEPRVTDPSLERYRRKVAQLLRDKGRLEAEQVRGVLALLTAARRRLSEELLAVVPGAEDTWQAVHLRELRAAVDRVLMDFAERYNLVLGGAMENAWESGAEFAEQALGAGGVHLSFAQELSREQLEVALTLRADLVRRVSTDAREGIARQVTLGVMGQKPTGTIMREVAAILRTQPDRTTGRMGTVADQAERIVRTEMGRTFSTANRLRGDEIAAGSPGLQHYWRSAHDLRTRSAHVLADQRYAPGGTPGPISYQQPFMVGGEKMRYPHDPLGSAANTINCRCVELQYHPDWFGK